MSGFKTLSEQAYEYIRAMILAHEFSHDTIYSETKLASRIGISRTPVREALVRLSQEGLIDIQQSRGFHLHRVSREELRQLFQTRLALEGFALIQLAQSSGEKASACIDELEENLSIQKRLSQEGAITELAFRDRKFHSSIISSISNSTLETLYTNQISRIEVLARQSFDYPGRIEQTLAEHAAIVEAVKAASPVEAYRAVNRHLENLIDIMCEMITEPESFSPF